MRKNKLLTRESDYLLFISFIFKDECFVFGYQRIVSKNQILQINLTDHFDQVSPLI